MHDLTRIQKITSNYFFWQGLRLVPFGFLFLIGAAGFVEPPLWPYTILPSEVVLLVAVILAYVAFQALGTYYTRVFGSVTDLAGVHSRREVVKWWIVYPIMGLSLIADWFLKWPIFLSGLTWGAALVAYWWSTGQGRKHYLVAALVLFALTPLPAFSIVAPGRPIFALFHAVVGVIYLVGGLLDHRELSRILGPIEEAPDARPI